jgi:DNA repair exonuclease SbcCD ATPase subunit
MLTRQEKEGLVIDSYNQGKTIRDIAKELRMSFRDIGATLKKASGEMEEKRDIKESLSPSSQAYRLFSKGKTPIEVAISLNLSEAETSEYYEEYLKLKQMDELKTVYDEIGDGIVHFLKLYRLSKSAHMSPEHVVNLLQLSNEYLPLTKEMDSMELEKQRLRDVGNQVNTLTKVLEKYKGEVKSLRKEKTKLSTLIAQFENCNEYKRIRQIAEEEVTNSLSKRRDLLKLATTSVIESVTRDPDKYNFLVSSGGQYTSSQPYIYAYRALILDEAQKIFELMVRDLTGRIINEAALTIHPQTM